MRLIEKAWYQNHPLKWLLLPLSVLFWLVSSLRRLSFRLGISKAPNHKIPVIVVGNIGVGGNGKTPVVVFLVEHFSQQGYQVGVISRGYGGKSEHYPLLVENDTPTSQAGDEPVLIKQRTNALVAVSPDRNQSVNLLIKHGCNLIIADDGLQHYKLARNVELVVVDGKRQFGNNFLMPAGPLREGKWRLNTVDQVIINHSACQEKPTLHAKLNNQAVYMDLVAQAFHNVKTGEKLSVSEFHQRYQGKKLAAVAGIGDPQRFFNTLSLLDVELSSAIGFDDHHSFCPDDFVNLSDNVAILMTEKDAVKCRKFSQQNWWYLAVSASFNEQDRQYLIQQIENKLTP